MRTRPSPPTVGCPGGSERLNLSVRSCSFENAPGVRHLNQTDLARRWRMSERTLERWRCQRIGPAYIKVGGHVVYRLQDILAYEVAQTHRTLASPTPTTGLQR